MAFFAIADLHLGFAVDKPMDLFGDQWENHAERIDRNWRKTVTKDDTVLIPGDISWAMRLSEAKPDLDFLASLPGRKVLIRGNHDYWWQSLSKVRESLPVGMYALQNDSLVFDGVTICGTRGWNLPGLNGNIAEDDVRLFQRERLRLEMSLKSTFAELPKIAMLHFPPRYPEHQGPDFCDLLEQYKVSICVYGHLHGKDHKLALRGLHGGVYYAFCAADALDFTPLRLELNSMFATD